MNKINKYEVESKEYLETEILENCQKIYEEQEYMEFLDDVYEEVDVCGYKYEAGRLLQSIDPIAFRCGMFEWLDNEAIEINGDYYLVSDIVKNCTEYEGE